MIKEKIALWVLGAILLWGSIGCSSTETITNSTSTMDNDPMTAEYYLNIKGGEARLVALMSGRFSCHSVNKKGLWRVNDGQDSMILHGCSLGEPAKDGYWVYQEIIMTHLPSEPMVQSVYKIEQVAPDSLILWKYKIKDKKQLNAIYKEEKRPFDKANLKQHSCTRYVKKRGQVDFWASVKACVDKRQDKTVWFDEYYQYVPQHIMQDLTQWSDPIKREESDVAGNRSVLYFKRLPKS
ncbi:MAG: CpcT/CpeT family chromophore lyase [Aureispira sp.]